MGMGFTINVAVTCLSLTSILPYKINLPAFDVFTLDKFQLTGTSFTTPVSEITSTVALGTYLSFCHMVFVKLLT